MLFYRQLKSGISRTASVIAIVCLIAVSASAYTLVMRSGRRVEIPDNFVVTRSTLTYEVSPGFQITLQMQAIDIGATERANREQPGALLRRIQPKMNSVAPATTSYTTGAVRTITNRDLQATMERRRQSEVAYHQRVKQLGLPSLEESQSRAAAESEALREELREIKTVEKESELYWRSRASALRTEMAVLDAEIQYVGARIDEYPPETLNGSFSNVTVGPSITLGNSNGVYYPGRSVRNRSVFGDTYGRRRSVYSSPNSNPQASNRGSYGRGRNRSNPYGRHRNGGIGIGGIGQVGVYPNIITTPPVQSDDTSYERSQLITRFNELSAERAGYNARWRQLEAEARRAGVPPGWLRE